jgi:polysaccharide pyruvyl transferase WcaK-like protein
VADLLHRARPDGRIVFHYGRRAGGSRHVENGRGGFEVGIRNCRTSPFSAPSEHIVVILLLAVLHRLGIKGPATRNPWLRCLLDAEFIGEIRGGDSFSDIYGLRRFVLGCLPLASVAILRRPYVMLPQTYGPFRSRAARTLAAMLLRRAVVILTRDRHCESIVRDLCGRTPTFCPDVAFTLEPARPARLEIEPEGFRFDQRELVVGLNVSGLLYMGGYTGENMFGLRGGYRELVNKLLESILTDTTARVLLVPHVFGSEQEEEACGAILQAARARHPGRVFAVMNPLTEREVKWVIGQTDFFIGSRMHACIAALSQGVPAVGLAYSDKFLGVFESVGAGEAIVDLREADSDYVISRTLAAIGARDETRKRLTAAVAEIRTEVTRTFEHLLFHEVQVAHQ